MTLCISHQETAQQQKKKSPRNAEEEKMKVTVPKFNWRSYAYGSISLCMIMKNEARFLTRCLNSVRGLVDELIICDTGSTDNSISIARNFGCKVLSDHWQDDFSRPRNLSIAAAQCNWILIMDPDEVILRKDHRILKELTRSNKIVAFQMVTRNYTKSNREMTYQTAKADLGLYGEVSGFIPSTKTRLFRNGLGICFEGCWHELLDYYIARNKLPARKILTPIHHWTHEINQKSLDEKKRFSLALGEKKVKEQPDHGQAWWELAVAESISGYRHRAIRSINKALSLGFVGKKPLATLARCYNIIGQKKRGRFAFEKAICTIFPNLTHAKDEFKSLEKLIR